MIIFNQHNAYMGIDTIDYIDEFFFYFFHYGHNACIFYFILQEAIKFKMSILTQVTNLIYYFLKLYQYSPYDYINNVSYIDKISRHES